MAAPRVKVQEGELVGAVEVSLEGKEYYSFKGIPYAEPPSGELRFKPPVPKKPWTGVREANKQGDACSQLELLKSVYEGSEDCLYLNVFTPRLPRDGEEDELLPVMFYIHPGGFVVCSGSVDLFSPDFIVGRDVVLVSINYRLGVLGFLCLDIPEAPGNVGLRDQTLAMKWVQQNIRAFNGDPDNVTIFGISAGSASVDYHLVSPMSEGLFHKAILQSGSALNPWARTSNPSKQVKNLCKSLGVDFDDPVQIVKFLQDVDVEKLVTLSAAVLDDDNTRMGEMYAFTPVIEKSLPGIEPFLNVEPLELLSSGKFNKVPTITGFCENEGALYNLRYIKHIENLKRREFINFVPLTFKIDRVYYDAKLREMYNQTDDTEAIDAFLSDLLFVGGINQSLKIRMRNSHLKNFVYVFIYDGSLNFAKGLFNCTYKGAVHGEDLIYLASNMLIKNRTLSATDTLVRNRYVQMWTDFAKTGHPTPELSELITAEWQPVEGQHMLLMEIGEELKMKTSPFLERMTLWEDLFDSYVNPE